MIKKDKYYSVKEIRKMDEEKSTQTFFLGYTKEKKARNRMGSKRGKSAIEKLGEKLLKKMEENNSQLRREIFAKMEENNTKLYEKLHAEIQEVKTELHTEMQVGFKSVNKRIDRVEKRLDYIVKVNKLKDLPK